MKRRQMVDTNGRGTLVAGPGGVHGRLVGMLNGVRWVAWEDETFKTMCEAFDAQVW